ncbi:MAG: ABC transporter ATP-binding protein, partial [Coprobacillus sp.]|nr:ABC transporter ATP-binding protein [Coprobacillus sp.]
MPRFQTTDKAQNAGWTFRELLHDLRKYWVPIMFVIICALLSCTLYIIVPSLLSSFTDNFIADLTNLNSVGEYTPNYIYANEEGIIVLNTSTFVIRFVLLVGCYLGTALLNWITTMFDIQFTTQYGYDIRKKLKEKLDKVPLKYYDNHITGDILSTVSNDVGNVSQELGEIIRQIISAVMMTVGVLIAMFIESWQLTLVALVTLPICIIIAWLIARQSQKHFQKYQDRLGDIEGCAEEYYSGFSVIKLFNKEEDTAADFDKYNKEMMDADYKSRFYSSLIFPCIRIVNNIGYVFVAVIGGLFGSVGNIVSFIMYLQMFTQPIQNLGELSSIIQQTLASAERVYTLLNEEEESPDPEGAISDPSTIKGALTFDHVDFSYDP